MSLDYLNRAVQENDHECLARYVRLHFGDGDEKKGAKEIDKGWVEALKLMLDLPETRREWILKTLEETDSATLAHLYFHLHFYFVKQSGEWIHDGEL